MSISNGPRPITDGLVFAYDMNNLTKSWRGKPATNTCSFGTYEYGYNSTKISNATPPSPPPVTGYPIYKITSNDGNDSQQILYTATVDQVNGGTYTHSAYVYLESGTWVSAGQHWNPWDYGSQQFIPRGVWTRIEDPVTNSGNNYGNVALCYNTNGAVYVTGSQYELGSVASPLVNGTRSNTQTITDLTNRYSITANSLTYSADKNFSFNGSSDYLTVTNGMNALVGTNTVTFSAWIYRTSAPNYWAGIISNKVNVTDGICLLVNPSSRIFWQYDGGTTGVYAIDSGATLALNTWYNIVGVYDNVGLKTYLNGVLNASAADAGKSISSAGNMDITIGAQPGPASHFPGIISQCSIYNRALSPDEILRNFNNQQSRYGI
jgi:hypothetical protein